MAVDITTIGIEYDTSGLIAGTNAQNQTTASANRMGDALANNEQQTKANNTASKAYATTLGALAAAFGVSQITRQIDEYTKYTAQLKLASNSNNEYLQSLDAVRKIATDSQASLAGTGTLYARIANGTRELGVAQAQVAKITESVNLSLKVSGATAAESASAQLQLAQAFASGTLRGEEFNAVNEAAPRLMKALADGIGVPVGALKDMASNGLITSEIMARVLPQALEQLREEAKNVQTLSGAFQVLKNNMMEFIGIQAQSNGIVSVLTSGIGLLASNLDILAGALITVAAVKFGNFLTSITTSVYSTVTANRALALSNLETARTNAVATASTLALAEARVIELRQAVLAASGAAALAVTMNGLIPAQARVTAASIAHTEALAAQTVAAGAASTGMGVLRGAMAFLGGPIGLIITALGIAATAWSVFGDSAEKANEKTKVSSLESTNEVIARLDVEISKLKERNKLRDSGVNISGASEANQAALAKAKQDYQDAISGTGGFSAPNEIAKAELIKATGAAYGTLLNKVKEVSDETEKLNGKTQSNKLAEWLGKNGTQAQKMAAAFAEAKKEVGVLTPEMESLIRLKFADKTATKSQTVEEQALNAERRQGYKLGLEMAKDFDKSMEQFAKDQINRTKEVTKSITDNILEQGKNYLSLKNKIDQYTESLNESNDLEKLEMSLIGSSNSERKIALEQYQIALTLKKQLAEIDKKNLSQGEKNMLASDAQEAANLGRMNISGKDRSVDIDVTKAKELLNIMSEIDNVTQKAAQGMADSFGRVGSAIGDLTIALSGYGRAQAAIAAKLADDNKKAGNDPKKLAAAQIDASQETARAQISSYANMAKAAKGFFKENSAGYRAMEGAEKAYRAVEMAMAIQTMLTKSGLLTAFTGLFVASKATETAATVASVAPDVAASMAKGTAAAAVGVASQAQGDPYTAWPRMAAMAAAMAALGFAVSGGGGGGGGQTAAQRQKEQGTGSVFGDASAKSDSIAKSIEDMSKTSNRLLPVNQNMLAALKNIESSMTGFTNLLARDQGVVDGSNLGIKTGMLSGGTAVTNLVAGIGEKVFGSSILGTLSRTISNLFSNTKQTVVDSGVSFGGSLKALEAGKGFNQYASVDTTKSSFFGLKKSTSNSQVNQSLSQELSSQMGLIFGGMSDALKEANKLLGGNAAEIEATFASLVLSTEKISLKGLSGDALTQALNGVISKSLDEMAQAVFPQYDKFRELGEGYAQTVLRVANTFGTANQLFEEVGLALFKVGDAGVAAAMNFTKLVGGLENLQSLTSSYYENFYTQEERNANTVKSLTAELEKQNLVLPSSRDGYRALVDEISKTGTSEQLASLFKLSDAFASVFEASDVAGGAITSFAQRMAAQSELIAQGEKLIAMNATSDRMDLVAVRRASDLAQETIRKASDDAFKTLTESVTSGMQNLIRAGDAGAAVASQMSISGIKTSDFDTAAGYNSAAAAAQAKIAQGLMDSASFDALNLQDVSSFMSGLLSFIFADDVQNSIKSDLAKSVNLPEQGLIGQTIAELLTTEARDYTNKNMLARGSGIASVIGAQLDLSFASYHGGGADVEAYNTAVTGLSDLLKGGKITQDEYATSLASVNQLVGDSIGLMRDESAQRERIIAAQDALSEAGIGSIAFYFDQIGKSVEQLNAAATQANTPLAQVTAGIGRLTSISDVFGQSAKAALSGGNALGNTSVINAQIVAEAAAKAAASITTADAAQAAKLLGSKESFAGVGGTQLRDVSMILDGLKQFDSVSFENSFMRMNDALNKGAITQEQYQDIFNQSLNTYQGLDASTKAVADAMEGLRKSMGGFADQLLIDKQKTTLTQAATMDELLRQYEVAKVAAMTGEASSVNKFQDLANQVLDVNKYGSRAEYNAAFGAVYRDARNLENVGARQGENVVEELKNLNKSQTARIDKLEDALINALTTIAKNTKDTVNTLELAEIP